MLEQGAERDVSITFKGQGFSYDGVRPIAQIPGLVTIDSGTDHIYPANTQQLMQIEAKRIGQPIIDSWEDPYGPYFFPKGRADLITYKSFGSRIHEVLITSELFDKATADLLVGPLATVDESERRKQLDAFFGIARWFVQSERGIILEAQEEPILQLHPSGAFAVNEDYVENKGADWEGIGKYRLNVEHNPFIECTIGAITVVQTVEDKTENGQLVSNEIPGEYYIVAGSLLDSFDAAEINNKIAELIDKGNLSNDAIKNLIYPYVYLTPAINGIEGNFHEVEI